jgi:cobalt-precorrin-5B (C1)-methyltransferase
VDIPLLEGGRLMIPISSIEINGNSCSVTVIKDAGDDPDVTHKARIRTSVRIMPAKEHGSIAILGGQGVGRVTRPGLPVPVEEWAINPGPRKQIKEAIREALSETGFRGGVSVLIEVINGERIARHTLNPRLGIVGGISILGTRGTVIPFSNEAYCDTIRVSMDVARAEGVFCIALSTGGKSEGFLRRTRPDLPETAFIQVADFFSFSIRCAVEKDFSHILYSCFFGKLVKMAQGHENTHAKRSRIDFYTLSRLCASYGMDKQRVVQIKGANTAREALQNIVEDPRGMEVIRQITKDALVNARRFAGKGPDITYYVFGFDGLLLNSQTDHGKGS